MSDITVQGIFDVVYVRKIPALVRSIRTFSSIDFGGLEWNESDIKTSLDAFLDMADKAAKVTRSTSDDFLLETVVALRAKWGFLVPIVSELIKSWKPGSKVSSSDVFEITAYTGVTGVDAVSASALMRTFVALIKGEAHFNTLLRMLVPSAIATGINLLIAIAEDNDDD